MYNLAMYNLAMYNLVVPPVLAGITRVCVYQVNITIFIFLLQVKISMSVLPDIPSHI